LVNYGVSSAEFDLWLESIHTFKDYIANPATQRTTKNQGKREIQNLLRTSMLLLYNQVDQVVFQLSETNPAYFGGYFSSRKLYPLTRHTKFRVRITNELGEPIYNVQVQQDNTDRIARTDMIGDATIAVQVEHSPGQQPVL
jgi:hypothetical protein